LAPAAARKKSPSKTAPDTFSAHAGPLGVDMGGPWVRRFAPWILWLLAAAIFLWAVARVMAAIPSMMQKQDVALNLNTKIDHKADTLQKTVLQQGRQLAHLSKNVDILTTDIHGLQTTLGAQHAAAASGSFLALDPSPEARP
jgi:hypothetical protein